MVPYFIYTVLYIVYYYLDLLGLTSCSKLQGNLQRERCCLTQVCMF